jgi:hypothetical protein
MYVMGIGLVSASRKNKKLTALKSNSNTVWFNFQIYIYVWKLNQTVLELDFWSVKVLLFPRRDLNSYQESYGHVTYFLWLVVSITCFNSLISNHCTSFIKTGAAYGISGRLNSVLVFWLDKLYHRQRKWQRLNTQSEQFQNPMENS